MQIDKILRPDRRGRFIAAHRRFIGQSLSAYFVNLHNLHPTGDVELIAQKGGGAPLPPHEWFFLRVEHPLWGRGNRFIQHMVQKTAVFAPGL
jgi:hypothetical protein